MSIDKSIQIKPSRKKGENKVSIILENELTIFSIEEMKDKIIKNVNKYDHIEIELKNISNMDLTFIQLFYSIKFSLEKQNKKVNIASSFSEDVKQLFINSDLYKVLK